MNNENKKNNADIEIILKNIYDALCEKGYDPARQLSGYLLSEDPVYIPNWNNARGMIRNIERDDILHMIVEYYFDNKFAQASECDEI